MPNYYSPLHDLLLNFTQILDFKYSRIGVKRFICTREGGRREGEREGREREEALKFM